MILNKPWTQTCCKVRSKANQTKYVLLLIVFKQLAINREKEKAIDIMPLPKQGA